MSAHVSPGSGSLVTSGLLVTSGALVVSGLDVSASLELPGRVDESLFELAAALVVAADEDVPEVGAVVVGELEVGVGLVVFPPLEGLAGAVEAPVVGAEVVAEGVGATILDGETSGPGSVPSPQAATATSAETLPMSSHGDFGVDAKNERRNMTNDAVRPNPRFRPTIRAAARQRRSDWGPVTTQRKSSGLDATSTYGAARPIQILSRS